MQAAMESEQGGFDSGTLYPLTLSFLAGLSTAVGGCIAVIKKPDEGILAFLLGLAFGVMAVLSVFELFLETGKRQGFLMVFIAFATGGAFFYFLRMLFPDEESLTKEEVPLKFLCTSDPKENNLGLTQNEGVSAHQRAVSSSSVGESDIEDPSMKKRGFARKSSTVLGGRLPPAEVMRLGLLMALTMTLHNMPEGFAVAFSAMTDLGPVMALSIALHNIPEGIVVAGPVYAATGNRWKAVGLAFASGMSEPFGACLALLLLGPYLTPSRLDLMLSCVGGIMLSVCIFELWPEAKKCENDVKMAWGVGFGCLVMGGTLFWT